MPQTTKIGIYSQTGEVSFSDVQKIAEAIDVQLKKDVCPAWDLVPWSCVAYDAPGDVPDDTIPLAILANSDQQGALGYHDVTSSGRAVGFAFSDDTLKNGGKVLDGDNSVAVTVSHECCEIVVDRKCNQWVTCSDGTMEALEIADRVEGMSCKNANTEASVSDFLFPAGFDPNAEPGAQRDYLRATTRDGEVTPGGYRIYLRPGKEQQEFARHVAAGASVTSDRRGAVHLRFDNGEHLVHLPSSGLFVHFGVSYPEHKKLAKLARASSRLRRRVRLPKDRAQKHEREQAAADSEGEDTQHRRNWRARKVA